MLDLSGRQFRFDNPHQLVLEFPFYVLELTTAGSCAETDVAHTTKVNAAKTAEMMNRMPKRKPSRKRIASLRSECELKLPSF